MKPGISKRYFKGGSSIARIILINISIFLLLMTFYFVFLKKEDLVLFPGNQDVEISFFTDKKDNGNSKVLDSKVSDSLVYFEFILGDSIEFSYAGLDVLYSDALLDVSGYNEFFIDYSSGTPFHMWLFANMKDKNIIDTSIYDGLRRASTDFEIESKKERVYFPLEEFSSPFWWYDMVNQLKKDFDDLEWNRLKSLTVTNGLNIDKGKKYAFVIHKIGVTRNSTKDLLLLLGLQVFSLIVSILLLFVKTKSSGKKEKVEIHYRPVVTEDSMGLTSDFLSYIHTNFSDPDLSLSKIAKETGISPRTISDAVGEKFNCNLKSYINQIRINEAKRLLKHSSLNINQIAYQVGFNSPANFNRVFKKITNMSPTEYIQSIS